MTRDLGEYIDLGYRIRDSIALGIVVLIGAIFFVHAFGALFRAWAW
jgi:hypothetical protein